MKKLSTIKKCIIFTCCFFLNTCTIQAKPQIVDYMNFMYYNQRSIYATSFFITALYLLLERALISKREELSEQFIPLYHEHTAYLESQKKLLNNSWENPYARHFNYFINWNQFYDATSPTREIAKKLKKLYAWEGFCRFISATALMAALVTFSFTIATDEKDLARFNRAY